MVLLTPYSGGAEMDAISELLDRLTHPLRVDRELQTEVRRELESHLQDAIAENRLAGMSADESTAQAVRALGDEKRLTSQLWQANRRRIRLRSWWRWGIGLIALPTAAAISVVVLSSVLLTLSLGSFLFQRNLSVFSFDRAQKQIQRLVDKMSPDDRLLYEGQLFAYGTRQPKDSARRALERWPEDPMLRANLLQAKLWEWRTSTAHDPKDVEPLLQLCDAGRRTEPDNGFYPLLKSLILLDISSKPQDDDKDTSQEISVVLDEQPQDSAEKPSQTGFTRYLIQDAVRFREGLLLFHEAAGKQYITDYSMALGKRRLQLMGEPRNLNDVLQGTAVSIGVLLPSLAHVRNAAAKVTSASVYPQLSATVGDANLTAPDSSIRDVYHVGQLMMRNAQDTGVLVEFLVGVGITDLAVAHAIYNEEVSHPGLPAQTLRRHHDELAALLKQATKTFRKDTLPSLGLVQRATTPAALNPSESEIRGGRQAEYALLDSAFVGLTMLLLVALGALATAPAVCLRLAGRATYVPLLPWRATVRTIGPSLLAAVVVIAALTLLPWTNRQFGLYFTGGGTFVQYIILLGIILLLLRHSLLRELRFRGLATGSSSWRVCVLPGLLVLFLAGLAIAGFGGKSGMPIEVTRELAVFVGIIVALVLTVQFLPVPQFGWERRASASNWLGGGSFLAFALCALLCFYIASPGGGVLTVMVAIGCVVGALIVLSLWLRDHCSIARPVGSSPTSLAAFGPVCILTALCLGLICLPLLKWQEHQGVTAMLAGRSYLMEHEVQRSSFNNVAHWLHIHPAPLDRSSTQE